MNPMHAAIKQRLGKHSASAGSDHAPTHSGAVEEPGHEAPADGKDLHGFVAGLSDQEKVKLKSLLRDDGANSMKIAQGSPSTEEHGKIADAMAAENEMHEMNEMNNPGGVSENESDDIGKSMLDSRHLRGMATEKPKNLGERVKQGIFSKLKAKGKI